MGFQTIGGKPSRIHQDNDNIMKAVGDGRSRMEQLSSELAQVSADLAAAVERQRQMQEFYDLQTRANQQLHEESLRRDAQGEIWKQQVDNHRQNLEVFTQDQRDYTSKAIRDLERDIVQIFKSVDKVRQSADLAHYEVTRLGAQVESIPAPPKQWPLYAAIGILAIAEFVHWVI